MPKIKAPLSSEELTLVSLARNYSDNDKARELLESLRWPNGPACPHCANDGQARKIYTIVPKPDSKRPARKGLYKCGACRKQFTVTVNTVFEDSHIPIGKWLTALFLLCSSEKGVSANQLHRMLDITYKSAWFMAHRIRFAMGEGPLAELLKGTVEIDETFVGGKGDHLAFTLEWSASSKATASSITPLTHKPARKTTAACRTSTPPKAFSAF